MTEPSKFYKSLPIPIKIKTFLVRIIGAIIFGAGIVFYVMSWTLI